MDNYAEFRKAKDDFFARHPQSPLVPEQKRNFHGLNYYSADPALRLELALEEFAEKSEVQMQTSTGDVQTYQTWGKIRFEVEGQPAELTILSNEHGFFLPFVDATGGEETYGAGRYLEPELLPDGKLLVDFNVAYNPYCAYNERWSCPIPPRENRLKVPIRAGEKTFEAH